MKGKLHNIENWVELGRKAGWSVTVLARLCKITPRTLERHFLAEMGRSPHDWLAEQRQLLAIEMLKQGLSVKETAANLGYKQSSNLSRDFRKILGSRPRDVKVQSTQITPENVAFGNAF